MYETLFRMRPDQWAENGGPPGQFWLLLLILSLILIVGIRFGRAMLVARQKADQATVVEQNRPWLRGQALTDLFLLVSLTALGVFILTPQAADFAHSPRFTPLLISAFAIYALWDTANGLVKGTVSPFSRGASLGPYTHRDQPKRYWASMLWNTFITMVVLTGAWFSWQDLP